MRRKNILIVILLVVIVVLALISWVVVTGGSGSESKDENTTILENTTDNAEEETANSLENYMNEQDNIMHTMFEEMHNFTLTGSSDMDFLLGMIPHHKAAIEMAQEYLEYGGESEEMKTLAKNIINAQQKEIELMNSLTENMDISSADSEKEKLYIEEYNTAMQNSHSHNMMEYDSIDKAFADGMTEHHQMAVDMSEVIVKYSENPQVKELANNIIETQKKEIEQMQNFMNR